jgi:hypothetical protein
VTFGIREVSGNLVTEIPVNVTIRTGKVANVSVCVVNFIFWWTEFRRSDKP